MAGSAPSRDSGTPDKVSGDMPLEKLLEVGIRELNAGLTSEASLSEWRMTRTLNAIGCFLLAGLVVNRDAGDE